MSDKQINYTTALLFLIVLGLVLSKPILLLPDSDGYLDMYIIRSPVYPLFLYLIKFIFGSAETIATAIIQCILGFYSIHYLVKRLRRHLKLSNIWYALITGLLLLPYIYKHHLANTIMSEALAYPLYLMVVARYIDAIYYQRFQKFYGTGLLVIALLLTRNQFLFMIPMGILIALYIAYKTKAYKNLAIIGIAFLALPVLSGLLDRSFHKLKHQHFVSTPWTGIVLISAPLYVADAEDYKLFDTPNERDFFQKSYSELTHKCLTINCLEKQPDANTIFTYHNSYANIANHTVLPVASSLFKENATTNETYIKVDQLTYGMFLPLVLDNFKAWIKLYLENIKMGYRNSVYMLLSFILTAYCLFYGIKNQSKVHIMMGFLLLLIIANIAFIAIGIHTISRYTFYNDWIIFIIIFILLNHFKPTANQPINPSV
ncbi:hypothetical protein [Psychroserpens sp. SPM9]|uniref:hypothetical protein n=1 Tax=Psychroserpens sp. SPM9 TaxID=2975598 RepID=UPI0021A7EC5D|nr:hypothetical protein [Psychroserpens sp. SPM9]MDG5492656.1 hypothetical protein [Psychroserpens sp. SPM9]